MSPTSLNRRARLRRSARVGAALAVGASLWIASPADAQERYRLENGDWQKQTTFDPATPEGQIQTIRRKLAEGDGAEAWSLAGRWIKRYPNHPLLVEAYLLRGDAKVARGEEYKGLFDYEYVIRQYPSSEQFFVALEREFEIAKLYMNGRKRKFLGTRMLDASEEAEEIFIRIQERAPGSELGERASLTLGDFYFNRGQMREAAEAYDLFLQNYPRSQYRERAMLRTIQSNLARFKGPRFDPTGLIEAAQRIKQYQQEYPAAADRIGSDALLVRIDESLAMKTYFNANWYDRTGRDWSAAYMWQRTVQDHPQTAAARAAMAKLADRGIAPLEVPTTQPEGGAATTMPLGPTIAPTTEPALRPPLTDPQP